MSEKTWRDTPMKNDTTLLLKDIEEISKKNQYIQTTILFGSVARDQAHEESDIDLCFVLRNNHVKNNIQNQVLALEKKYNKNINIVITNTKFERLDRHFIETLLREGIVLYGKIPEIPIQQLELEPYEIIKYNLSTISHSEKMKIKRLLYGVTTKKTYKGKIYENKQLGKVEQFGGLRIGIASILIPEKMSWQIEEMLKKQGIKLRKITIWLSKS
jgi:predicted nucleotidyltransferase